MEKILVVDDDQLFLDSITKLLSDDYAVEGASSGTDALDRLKDKKYDLIISDYNMPMMHGLDFLKELRSRNNDTEVILITGYGTFEMAVEALENNASTVLSKPVEAEVLESAIKKAIQRNAAKDKDGILEIQQMELQKMRHLLSIGWNRFRTLFDIITDPVIMFNSDLRLIEANKAAWTKMALMQGAPLEKQPYYITYRVSNSEYPTPKTLLEASHQEAKIYNFSDKKLYQIDAYPVIAEDTSNIVSVVEIHRDITNLVRHKERHVKAEKFGTKINLAAEVGHELKNMITGIRLLGDQMKLYLENDNLPKVKRNLKMMDGEIEKIITYTTRLMSSHIDDKKVIKIHLTPFLDSLINFLQFQQLYFSVNFKTMWEDGDIVILGDELQLQEIFTNLFKNAAEATEEGTITITTKLVDKKVKIEISNDGPDIPQKIIKRLFDERVSTKTNGHGYGLMIVKRLVEQNNGRIDIFSASGEGARIVLSFPIIANKINQNINL